MVVANENWAEDRRQEFRHELLSVRRRMLGLSQAELAQKAEMSQASYSKVEQGLKPVAAWMVEKFGHALNCPTSFFFQAEREYGPPMSAHPMYRKRASVGLRVLDKVIGEFNVRLAHIRTLLRSVDIEPELPLPSYDADDFEGGAVDVADAIRRAWYLPQGPIASVTECLERAGCVVVPCAMDQAKIDAASYRVSGLPPVIFVNRGLPGDRLRFTLAHELGHLVMHRFPTPAMEQEADAFAAAFLMPAADIAPELSSLTLAKAAAMKPIWKVSIGALIYRASDLGTIRSTQAEYLWKVRAAKGWSVREPADFDVPVEQPTLLAGLFEHMLDDNDLSLDEIGEVLHLHLEELQELYRLQPPQPHLRRVK
jgi:Zn-dependent peptidase ImmA (M78 family)/transcriptional regulator with XRE-family HTH domain